MILRYQDLEQALDKKTMISLSKEETATRFGVEKAIEHFPSNITAEEEKYVKTVLQYMDVSATRSDYCSTFIVPKRYGATRTTLNVAISRFMLI